MPQNLSSFDTFKFSHFSLSSVLDRFVVCGADLSSPAIRVAEKYRVPKSVYAWEKTKIRRRFLIKDNTMKKK